MKSALLITSLLGVFAIGYFAGTRDPLHISKGHSRGTAEFPEGAGSDRVTTLAERSGGTSGLDGAPAGALEEQMAELMEELKGKAPYGYYMDQLGTGRLLLRAESILARAEKEEVLGLLADWDMDSAIPLLPGVVFQRLAQFSPEEAAAVWLDMQKPGAKMGGFDGIIRVWLKEDPDALEAWVDSITDEKARAAAGQALILPLADVDPQKAMARLEDIDDANQKRHLGTLVASAIGAKTAVEELPAVADEFLQKKDGGWEHQNQLQGVISSWAARDLDGAIDWLTSQEPGALKDHIVSNSLNREINKDPQAFAERLSGKLEEGSPFAKLGGQLFRQWIQDPDEIDNALAWFQENGKYLEAGQPYYNYRTTSIGEEDVIPMLEKISGLPDYPVKANVMQGLLWQLQQNHPEKTLEFAIENLPAGGENDSSIANMINNWAQKSTDPAEAIQWAMDNMNPGGSREMAVRFGISAWARTDPEAAMDHVMQLPEAERKDALWGIAHEWPKKDGEGALRFIREANDAEQISSFTNSAFYEFVSVRGGERTLEAAMKMPQGKKRQDAVEGAIRGWTYKDAGAAAAALEELERGFLRDTAIGAFSSTVTRTDPRAGFAWALQIENESQRRRRALSAGRNWLSSDRKNAREWIESSQSVPADIREELLKAKK